MELNVNSRYLDLIIAVSKDLSGKHRLAMTPRHRKIIAVGKKKFKKALPLFLRKNNNQNSFRNRVKVYDQNIHYRWFFTEYNDTREKLDYIQLYIDTLKKSNNYNCVFSRARQYEANRDFVTGVVAMTEIDGNLNKDEIILKQNAYNILNNELAKVRLFDEQGYNNDKEQLAINLQDTKDKYLNGLKLFYSNTLANDYFTKEILEQLFTTYSQEIIDIILSNQVNDKDRVMKVNQFLVDHHPKFIDSLDQTTYNANKEFYFQTLKPISIKGIQGQQALKIESDMIQVMSDIKNAILPCIVQINNFSIDKYTIFDYANYDNQLSHGMNYIDNFYVNQYNSLKQFYADRLLGVFKPKQIDALFNNYKDEILEVHNQPDILDEMIKFLIEKDEKYQKAQGDQKLILFDIKSEMYKDKLRVGFETVKNLMQSSNNVDNLSSKIKNDKSQFGIKVNIATLDFYKRFINSIGTNFIKDSEIHLPPSAYNMDKTDLTDMEINRINMIEKVVDKNYLFSKDMQTEINNRVKEDIFAIITSVYRLINVFDKKYGCITTIYANYHNMNAVEYLLKDLDETIAIYIDVNKMKDDIIEFNNFVSKKENYS